MNQKIGRNDPCPCGSGKKYKHCCGKPAARAAAPAESHEGAVERALAWLEQHHRKGFAAALEAALDEAVFEVFDNEDENEDEVRDAIASIGDELSQQIQINLTEWLLAEGDIQVKGEHQRVAELLLGPRGPLLTTGQRDWLEQLARRPLRLYDVTEVVPGVGITVCDALDTDQSPQVVAERAGSQSLQVGMQIGARVMEVGGRHLFSGAIYPFSVWSGGAVQARLRDLTAAPNAHEEDDIFMAGLTIIEGWLAQHLLPEPLPELIDSHSGESLLFISDHYAVRDWDALSAALAAQPDVRGDREAGWERLLDCDDGQTRSQAMINAEPDGHRVGVMYRTARLAEQGRTWFDALAGDSVKFDLRRVSDPKDFLSDAAVQASQAQAKSAAPRGLTPRPWPTPSKLSSGAATRTGPTSPSPRWRATRRARRSRASLAWSASKACCAAMKTVRRGRPRSKNAAQFPTSSCGPRWACSDSPSLPMCPHARHFVYVAAPSRGCSRLGAARRRLPQPGLECLGQPLQNGGFRQR